MLSVVLYVCIQSCLKCGGMAWHVCFQLFLSLANVILSSLAVYYCILHSVLSRHILQVWTVAQVVNFQVVPLEYRVLFGNMVALWWNIYLSLASHTSE